MLAMSIKLILSLLGLLMLDVQTPAALSVAAFLSAVTLTSLNGYFASRRFTVISSLAYFAASAFFPPFCPFLPLFCFDLFEREKWGATAFVIIPLLAALSRWGAVDAAVLLAFILLAVLTRYICGEIARLTAQNTQIQDSSIEQSRLLTQQNKSLMEKQDYEIHLATLKERNRIAREIHDNVGHILTRSILQAAALGMQNKDDGIREQLAGLKDTLTLAMDSIRGSVHDLRDDSVDLYDALAAILEPSGYEIDFDYDATPGVSNDVKYCFIAAVKEGLTNIVKHSDATAARVTVREHPALYQLLIHDNGAKKHPGQKGGMGLSNMEERVTALGGQFSASYQNGFRIFISIPKREDAK